jgi:hypothetical protein
MSTTLELLVLTISDMYRITMADSKPTPIPAMRRPATMAARGLPAPVIIWMTTPNM